MRIPCYHVDAFTARPFHGNPAGVCPLETWLPDEVLQGIAAENNLPETAFFIRRGETFDLRWFSPKLEVDLCGHATLATAWVLFSELAWPKQRLDFDTRSGRLIARIEGDLVTLDFPSRPAIPCAAPAALVRGLGAKPSEVFRSVRAEEAEPASRPAKSPARRGAVAERRKSPAKAGRGAWNYLAVFDSQTKVAALDPDMHLLATLDSLGVIATARGKGNTDFVSRFFAPKAGIPEDPVTGSAHCTLIPFWAERLGKNGLFARQISKRGGELYCRNAGSRVFIAGNAVIYGRSEIDIPG